MRRLKRSGDMVPLDIDLRDLLCRVASPFVEDFEYQEVDQSSTLICPREIDATTGQSLPCDCPVANYKCMFALIILLTGENGRLCQRWRHVTLSHPDTFYSGLPSLSIVENLGRSTPMLVSLTLHYIIITQEPFLPQCPALKYLALNNSSIPRIPNVEKLLFIGISWTEIYPPSAWKDLNFLKSATQLVVLKLNLPSPPEPLLELDTHMTFVLFDLTNLELRGKDLFPGMDQIYMPSLTHVSIGVKGIHLLRQFVNDMLLPVQNIRRSILWYDGVDYGYLEEMRGYVVTLLHSLRGLETFSGDVRILSVVLKLIWETTPIVERYEEVGASTSRDPVGLFKRQMVAFNVIQGSNWYILHSRRIRSDVVTLAAKLGVICPDEDWDYIFKRFHMPWLGPG